MKTKKKMIKQKVNAIAEEDKRLSKPNEAGRIIGIKNDNIQK